MAIYHLRIKSSNKKGKSILPTLHLDYINREGKYSDRDDLILSETKNLPEEFKDIKEFWECCEAYERKNSNLYRELEISLPKELSVEENQKLVKEFTSYLFENDYVYNYSIHVSKDYNEEEQPHVHVMFCERKLDGIKRSKEKFFSRGNTKNPERGGAKKSEIWTRKETLLNIRKDWETFLNIELEKRGIEKVSCKTLKEQKRIAELNREKEKVKKLDRDPINIEGHILYLKESKLKEEEREKKEIFKSQRVLKSGTSYMGKILDRIKKLKSKIENFNREEFEILERIRSIDSEINVLKIKKDEKKIEDTVYNLISNKEYYNLLNDNKKIEKELKSVSEKGKIQQLKIRKNKNIERIEEIKREIKNNPKKRFVFEKRKEQIINKYNKKIKEKEQEKKDYNIYIKENYNEYTDLENEVYGIKHLQTIYNEKTIKEINKIENEYSNIFSKLANDKELLKEENRIKDSIRKTEYGKLEKEIKEVIKEIDFLENKLKETSINREIYLKSLNKNIGKLKKLKTERTKIDIKIEKEFKLKLVKSTNEKIQEKLKAEKILNNIRSVKKSNNLFEKMERVIDKKDKEQEKTKRIKLKSGQKWSSKLTSGRNKNDELYGNFTLKDLDDLEELER